VTDLLAGVAATERACVAFEGGAKATSASRARACEQEELSLSRLTAARVERETLRRALELGELELELELEGARCSGGGVGGAGGVGGRPSVQVGFPPVTLH
jgi:hypothetical protein